MNFGARGPLARERGGEEGQQRHAPSATSERSVASTTSGSSTPIDERGANGLSSARAQGPSARAGAWGLPGTTCQRSSAAANLSAGAAVRGESAAGSTPSATADSVGAHRCRRRVRGHAVVAAAGRESGSACDES